MYWVLNTHIYTGFEFWGILFLGGLNLESFYFLGQMKFVLGRESLSKNACVPPPPPWVKSNECFISRCLIIEMILFIYFTFEAFDVDFKSLCVFYQTANQFLAAYTY